MTTVVSADQTASRIGGQKLRSLLTAAAAFLEAQADSVNALNVFPVPDGDTGTNMSMTMRATVDAVADLPEHHVGRMLAVMKRGAMMGARGNSGVILSQIIRGFADSVAHEPALDSVAFAAGLSGASQTAYAGVTKPVEGTILTVIRKAAEAAARSAPAGDVEATLAAAVEAAHTAVLDTPNQLAVLRDAGVVDAGGQGLAILLDGALRSFRGEPVPERVSTASKGAIAYASGEQTYGYCTEFLIQGDALEPDDIRSKLEKMGDSLLVVGESSLVRVHVHTFDPGSAISLGTRLGTLRQVKIDNMQLQHETWREHRKAEPIAGISLVAVAAGDGFVELFSELNVQEIVPGGQTMNPSTQDLVAAIERTPTSDVILLPNNENIILAAKQAVSLTTRRVGVIPTKSLAQGIGAALAMSYEATFDQNVMALTRAAERVDTGEVTVAVRDAVYDGLTIASGQAIGLLNGRLEVVAGTLEEAFRGLVAKMRPESAELLTLYRGGEAGKAEAEALGDLLREQYPELVVEVVDGGQPFYRYIIARE